MPEPLSGHAIVALNESTYMLIGGSSDDDDDSDKTYYFSEKTQQWTQGPNLNHGRHGHTAGLIIDEVTAQTYVVVAGGQCRSCGTKNKFGFLVSNGQVERLV